MTRLTKFEKQRPKWQAAMRRAWLKDHPGKTAADYERAGTCRDTERGRRAYSTWFDRWMRRKGYAIHSRLFAGCKGLTDTDARARA